MIYHNFKKTDANIIPPEIVVVYGLDVLLSIMVFGNDPSYCRTGAHLGHTIIW